MSHQARAPPQSNVITSARTIAQILGNQQSYAVVGGAACVLLGSTRATFDVDFVVPKGETKAARALLKSYPDYFDIDKKTLHTFYRSEPPVEIEILAPPALFREDFSSSTSVVEVQGVRVLQPTLLLNAKCNSILGRARSDKKDTDAEDIQFLLQWCTRNNVRPKATDVPAASLEFVQWFINEYGNEALWRDAGFDLKTGKTQQLSQSLNVN
ncbi:hypothetical protein IL306_006417 [Fusarium sp. DS 682]|nr:hypothetical protein IL306_006417 [Fusarium sp. DS 682]